MKLRMLVPLAIVVVGVAASEPDISVQQALQKAIDGERAAQSRYAVFAEQAKSEGYSGAASLFRAAAAAEKVHEQVFRTLLQKRNAEAADAAIEPPAAATTRENLTSSVEAERQERDGNYHHFREVCHQAGDKEAAVAFDTAMTAESEHSNLMMTAAWDLERMKSAKTFYVCSLCGYTSDVQLQRCPSCRRGGAKLNAVE